MNGCKNIRETGMGNICGETKELEGKRMMKIIYIAVYNTTSESDRSPENNKKKLNIQ